MHVDERNKPYVYTYLVRVYANESNANYACI